MLFCFGTVGRRCKTTEASSKRKSRFAEHHSSLKHTPSSTSESPIRDIRDTNAPSIPSLNSLNAHRDDHNLSRSTRNDAHVSVQNHGHTENTSTRSTHVDEEPQQGSDLQHRRGFYIPPIRCPSGVPAQPSAGSASTRDLEYILNNSNANPVVVIQHFYQTPRMNDAPGWCTRRNY